MSALRSRKSSAALSKSPAVPAPEPPVSDAASRKASRLAKLRTTLRRHLRWHSAHACAGVVESNVPLVTGGSCGISRAVVFHFPPKTADRPAVNLPQEPSEKFATM
ncbi:MAG: hypothetical protein JWM88_619 [Verrucomicrobia bacterium]|nr:hypothetical protein [Verrucomicrobiota bacterium]